MTSTEKSPANKSFGLSSGDQISPSVAPAAPSPLQDAAPTTSLYVAVPIHTAASSLASAPSPFGSPPPSNLTPLLQEATPPPPTTAALPVVVAPTPAVATSLPIPDLSRSQFKKLTVDGLIAYLAAKDVTLQESVQQIFRTQEIDGDGLLGMTLENLTSCKVVMGTASKIMQRVPQ